MVKHDIQGIVGHLTSDILEKIRINKLFLGADGVSPGKGIYTSSEMEAFTKVKMMGCSQEIILVADSLKIGQTALVKFSSLQDMDMVITDRGCQKKFLREFHKMKIKLAVV
jgi:DeoR/GlpR family transcriptional regulator of sugar metabolism